MEERVVHTDPGNDPEGTALGASALIRTIVWAIVVLVLLAVALYLLHVYTGVF